MLKKIFVQQKINT